MNRAYKEIFKSWRVVLLLILIVLAIVTIQPQFGGTEGVSIRAVGKNSSAANGGLENPSAGLTPLSREIILSVNGEKISTQEDYFAVLKTFKEGQTVRLETNEKIYTLVAHGNVTKVDLGLKISDAPASNLRKGLDLEGGTRVLLKPESKVSSDDLELIISNLKERLNVFGLSDIIVRSASDLAGVDFILIEIAGVTEDEVKELLGRQGKFEAKIGEETVFFGGKNDIPYVCRTPDCSGIDSQQGCGLVGEGQYACGFFFSITLSNEAAQRHADITAALPLDPESGGQYLSEDLTLVLDDVEVDTLRIGSSLKGRATTSIQISGSGTGRTQEEALSNSLEEMKKLQTVIITGSLPVKLEIVKLDTVSPSLGQEFLDNILFVGLLVILAVIAVVMLRYRKLKIAIPMVFTLLAEMVLILGFAALVGWNLDLAAIAGIIIVAGTGVDHLIVITDETIRGETVTDWKRRIKSAMFIVLGAYFTTVAGMLPLLWAGAGLLKGFALTTIAGISFGVLFARPAYAIIIEKLLK
jgi:preprotein translocase subunit SecD